MPDWSILAGYWTNSIPDKGLIAVIADLREGYTKELHRVADITCQAFHASFEDPACAVVSQAAMFEARELENGLDLPARNRFSRNIQSRKGPDTFWTYFDLYCDYMSRAALDFFQHLLKIGEANASLIPSDFSLWAEKQTVNVIGSYSKEVAKWAVDMCDIAECNREDDSSVTFSIALFEISGRDGKWRAPRFLLMNPGPIPNGADDAARAWERQDVVSSVNCLRRLINDYCCLLEMRVKDEAQRERLLRAESPRTQRQMLPDLVEKEETSKIPVEKCVRSKEALLIVVRDAKDGDTLTRKDTCEIFGISERTLKAWVHQGKLSNGARRGSITIASIKKLQKS